MNTKDISKTFCVYPWTHSYQGCQYERKLCCIGDDIKHLQKTTTEEFWNSNYMRQTRKKMLKGEEVSGCRSCYKNERLGISSLREEANFQYDDGQFGSDQLKDMIINTDPAGNYKGKPKYYDYRTIHCNLQCVSCGSIYSSTWQNLNKEMWGQKPKFKPDYAYENKMAEEMIEGLNEKRINNIYWAGGEPFMQPLHWKVIEHIVNLSKDPGYANYIKTINMHYNTNLTKREWKKQNIPEMLEPFQPSIQASLDGTHETIEYTRDGVKWEDIDKHWKEYHSLLNKKQQMGVATVTSAPVLFDIERYLEYYGPYDPYLHPHYNFVRLDEVSSMPGFLDIRLYPEDIFYPTMEKVKREMKASGLRGSEKWIQIMEGYEQEFKDINYTQDELEVLKGLQLHREMYLVTKRTLSDLYRITNPAAAEWIDSLSVKFVNEYVENKFKQIPTQEIE